MNDAERKLANDIRVALEKLNSLFVEASRRKLGVEVGVSSLSDIEKNEPLKLEVEVWVKL